MGHSTSAFEDEPSLVAYFSPVDIFRLSLHTDFATGAELWFLGIDGVDFLISMGSPVALDLAAWQSIDVTAGDYIAHLALGVLSSFVLVCILAVVCGGLRA